MTLTPSHRLPRIAGVGEKGQSEAVDAEIAEQGRLNSLSNRPQARGLRRGQSDDRSGAQGQPKDGFSTA